MENPFYKGKRQAQTDKAINPFKFVDKDKPLVINPFYIAEEHPNDQNKFAILKTTENGKYVRGGMLYFNMRGIEIYTELNNAIFVDLINNTLFIKEYQKVLEEITPKDPEKRQYIIMMTCEDEDGQYFSWEAMEGRTTMYNYIVENIESLGISPNESFVLTENVPYKDALTVAEFIRYLKNAEYVEDDGFDIEEYIY